MTTEALQTLLEYQFRDPVLLRTALTHRSFLNEHPGRNAQHNERLEFLGDAVLDFILSDILMQHHPGATEGELSKFRASLVSEDSLAEIARDLCIGPALLLGKGEEISGGSNKNSLLSDALEALIAAIYLDSVKQAGVEEIRRVILGIFESRVETVQMEMNGKDSKTELQEFVQKNFKMPVQYTILAESGPDHQKSFEAAVVLETREWGRGLGQTKKQAEQAAAREALNNIRADSDRVKRELS